MSDPIPELILASTSPARRALMEGLGLPYRAVAPQVDEDLSAGTSPRDAVAQLAERKARAVFERFPNAFVIGSDQLVEVDGEALGKPVDRAQARRQLGRILDRDHHIVTGLCLLGPGVRQVHVETTRLRFHPLGDDELERYLDLGEWEGCAGSYRIESAGMGLLAELEGDLTNVRGMPMIVLVRLLREAGIPFFHPRGG